MMNVSENLHFDILPLHLREWHHYNEIITAILSYVLNFTLVFLLLTEKNKTLEAYTRVLTQNCLIDIIATTGAFISQSEAEFIDGRVILILNGAASDLPLMWHYLIIGFYAFATSGAIIVPTVFFYFRYVLILEDRILSLREYLIVLGIALTTCVSQGFALGMAVFLNHNEKREAICHQLLSHPVWLQGDITKCLVSSAEDFFLWDFLVGAGVLDMSVYAIMSFCTLKIVRHLRNKASSERTAKLQKQLNRMLACQMIIPLFTGILPIVIVSSFTIFHITVPGIGIIVTGAMTWMPLVSPFTTILFVSSFRLRLVGYITRRQPKISNGATSKMVSSSVIA